MINYGIDLGTTNSVIAKFNAGEVELFKDPIHWKDTLPSVVGFKKDKILIGSKAREYLHKDPHNVVGGFKRKMGTTETFPIKTTGKTVTPIELSSYIIKELKTFIHDREEMQASVITIPACFDTIQSNATKEAGLRAGLKQVLLLQEPIAASLAYANKAKEDKLSEGQWLVYDLGGGTFDIALVKIQNGEMRIVDHDGNNFLGGKDFDETIVEKLIVPYLEEHYDFQDLLSEMTSASGKYNKEYMLFLSKAEGAKIELSSLTSAEIEFEMNDDAGNQHEGVITISRSEFENLIKERIDETIQLTKKVLTKNSALPADIQFVLMVGGSTYIPFTRKRVEELLQIPVNCKIDPTTAVALGAAYYAGTKPYKIYENKKKIEQEKKVLEIKCAYRKTSNDKDEFFAARIDGAVDGLSYRIIREDGGFDTGLKPLTNRISEDLPLVPDNYNFFKLSVMDDKHNIVETNVELIGIAQGKYSVVGQPQPEDICLQLDDVENKSTFLHLLFNKNSILPLRRKETLVLNKTILKNSEELFEINVREGDQSNSPASNRSIGVLQISGKQLKMDAMKGTDVEIIIEISESQDLTISALVTMTGQEFEQIFSPTKREVPIDTLRNDVETLIEKINQELEETSQTENYELAGHLGQSKEEIAKIEAALEELPDDDVRDKKFQLEDKKNKISQEYDKLTKDARFMKIRKEYYEVKQRCFEVVEEDGNDIERKRYYDIVEKENVFIGSQSIIKTRESIDVLIGLMYSILWRTPKFLIGMHQNLKEDSHRFNDQQQAKSLLESGKVAIENENYDRLREINGRLIDLLPEKEREAFKGTGLSRH